MAVYKEINRADGSGVTTFYRISDILDTAETDDKESQSVVIDYNQAQNKPSINGVALVGNKTSENLGLQPAGDYITNNEADEKFIDEDELEAKNYVNQTELQDAIAHIEHFHREIVEALPVTGMDNVLYMVRKGGTGEDIYNEYIWVGLSNSENGYEFLGTTATDLTDYYKKSQVDAALATKVDKEGGKGLSEENYTLAEKTKLAGLKNYDDTEIQAEVSGLNTDINNLKKSNVTISNTLAELKPDVDSNTAAVSTIYDLLDNKMTAIRLVEQGDGWVWMNLEGSRLTYAQASAALGHENCMLFIEQLENDGKVIPAEYKSDGNHINVIFKDLDSLVHIMTCGEDDVVVTKDVTTTNGQVDFTVEDEAIGYTTKMTALYGKSTQATRSGKNKLDANNPTSNNNARVQFSDDIITISSNVTNTTPFVRWEIDTPEDRIYKIRFAGILLTSKAQVVISYYANDKWNYLGLTANYIDGTTISRLSFSAPAITTKVGILLYSDKDIPTTSSSSQYKNVIVTVDNDDMSYEPYGVSPSPDYPSEIGCVKDTIQVKDVGKNLIPNNWKVVDVNHTKEYGKLIVSANLSTSYLYGGSTNFIGLTLKAGTYTFSASSDTFSNIYAVVNNNGTIENWNNGITKTFTTDVVVQSIRCNEVTLSTGTYLWIAQIEKGTSATEYEEFKSNSLTINLQGNELCSIGDVKDELVIENGRAKIIKKVGKYNITGNESWALSDTESQPYINFSNYVDNCKYPATSTELPNLLSNYYLQITRNNLYDGHITLSPSGALIIYDTVHNTSLANFKEWLKSAGVVVYYQLETPIEIEITDPTLLAQLNALEQITQYKHTYITITGDDLTPEADFTYINNVVINNTDSVLGKDTYWNDEVPTQQDLPSKAQEGEIRIVQDTEEVYIYNGTKWVPFDKNSEVDLSNYLTKDNTTPWVPTGPFNPSTKKYVDDKLTSLTGYDASKTQVLKNINGTLTWVEETQN